MAVMLVPVILMGVSAAAGAFGVRKGIDANRKNEEASAVMAEVKDIITEANRLMKAQKEQTQKDLELFSKSKIHILSNALTPFVSEFKKIKNVDFKKTIYSHELSKFLPQSPEIADISEVTFTANKIASAGTLSTAGSALVSFGAYGSVMYGGFAAASTGTAIGTLSGAAATNATLAWLGGGSLATGGMGIAGGTAVLGGLVAGPALALGGAILDRQAENKLLEALTNKDEAIRFQKNVNKSVEILRILRERSKNLNRAMVMLSQNIPRLIGNMRRDNGKYQCDYRLFSEKAKDNLCIAAMIAKVIKGIVDVKLLDDKGNLTFNGEKLNAVLTDKRIGQGDSKQLKIALKYMG
ncbi:MAG: hypothetical protein IJ849_04670 [Selenomonadaceae bacterium]|nr:hypothetical protein [Selenomonadaceae bacterium]